jgi:hypothetical protein
MQFAYLTFDEVNEHLAQEFAKTHGVHLDWHFRPDTITGREYDAVLCDLDSLPPDEREANLSALLTYSYSRAVAVHSYNLEAQQRRLLRRRNVIVARRLRAKVCGRLVAAVRTSLDQYSLSKNER